MEALRVQIIEMELEALNPLGLGAQVGVGLRGALFDSMRSNLNVCLYKELPSCQPCTLRQVCPLSGLLATVDDEAERGHDVPRPMAMRPPTDGRRFYPAGSHIRFGAALFGEGGRYVPYLVLAARELERSGLGLNLDGDRRQPPKRGQVRLGRVEAVHPLNGMRETIREAASDTIRSATLAVTPSDVDSYAATLPQDRVTLEIMTPLRLIERGQLVRPLRFDALVWRLAERVEALARHYGGGSLPGLDRRELVDAARSIRTVQDETHWLDVEAHSGRTGRWSPTGGYVGRVTFGGELAPFLSLLAWGTLTQVGKSATRGNGYYRLAPAAKELP